MFLNVIDHFASRKISYLFLSLGLTDKNLNFDPPSPGLEVQHVACVAAHISVPPISSRLMLKYLYQSLKCLLSFALALGESFLLGLLCFQIAQKKSQIFNRKQKQNHSIEAEKRRSSEIGVENVGTYRTVTDLLTVFSFVALFVMGGSGGSLSCKRLSTVSYQQSIWCYFLQNLRLS